MGQELQTRRSSHVRRVLAEKTSAGKNLCDGEGHFYNKLKCIWGLDFLSGFFRTKKEVYHALRSRGGGAEKEKTRTTSGRPGNEKEQIFHR